MKKFEVKERLKSELIKAIRENKGYQFRYGRPFYHDIEIITARKTMREPLYTSKITNRKRKGIWLRCGSFSFDFVERNLILRNLSGERYIQEYDSDGEMGNDVPVTDEHVIKAIEEAHKWACEYINILRLAFVFYNPAHKKKNSRSKILERAYPHREYIIDDELRVRILFQRPLLHEHSNIIISSDGTINEDVSYIRWVTTVVPVFKVKTKKGSYRRAFGSKAFKIYLYTRASLTFIAGLHPKFESFFKSYVNYKLSQRKDITKKAREFHDIIVSYYYRKHREIYGHDPRFFIAYLFNNL